MGGSYFPYHREAGKTLDQQVMGYTNGRGSATYGGDIVDGHIRRPSAGDGSTVGGPMTITVGISSVKRI